MKCYKTESVLIAGITLFLFVFFTDTAFPITGDLNNDRRVDLADAIVGINLLVGNSDNLPAAGLPLALISPEGRLGLDEVIFVLQKLAGLRNFMAVAAGEWHTAALNGDGTVWIWGYNGEGQLGDGKSDFVDRSTPGQVVGLSGVAAIASGSWHMAALKNDGTVWTWGYGEYGQLGDGANVVSRSAPVRVSNLHDVVAVASGGYHTAALKNDGTVWTWGDNWYWQLGDGTDVETRNVPVLVSDLTGIAAIAGGGNHTVALKNDGTVWTWGDNWYGQLGDGTTVESRSTPVQVSNLTGIAAIAGGGNHTVALKNDGTVWTWGDNTYGQLGDGTTVESRSTPVRVSNLTGIVAIAGGGNHTVALKNDGAVWTWGDNTYGQLGDGTGAFDRRNTPGRVIDLTRINGVAGGGSHYDPVEGAHTVAVSSDGGVWTWGDNTYGQLADEFVPYRDKAGRVTFP